jgi:threonylcarbamoyladenosine tRNA methylthiotransferase MtaB
VFGNHEKDNLVINILNLPREGVTRLPIQREPIPGSRMRTRSFIKVQDGCNNQCTYCITRIARGASTSRSVNAVLTDIQSALDGGTQEIVLTGVHLGSWGYDFSPPSHLSSLVSTILAETQVPRLRLSSLEPWDIPDGFFKLWQNPRLCRHLHLPLQSGCDATLKRMGRRVTTRSFSALVDQARRAIPGVSITTDIITGFPGETDVEFSTSQEFVSQMNFAKGHVFTYSNWPTTSADRLPDHVPHQLARERNARMRHVFRHSSGKFLQAQLGQTLEVLWEKAVLTADGQWDLSGFSDNYVRVRVTSPCDLYNQITAVQIMDLSQNGLVGEIMHKDTRPMAHQDTL